MKRWTENEEALLRELWQTDNPVRVIALTIGRPTTAVYAKAFNLGLPRKDNPNKIKLTNADMLWLKLNFPHIRTELCAMKLGISLRSCIRLARRLGVEKSQEFMRECCAYSGTRGKGTPRPRCKPQQTSTPQPDL